MPDIQPMHGPLGRCTAPFACKPTTLLISDSSGALVLSPTARFMAAYLRTSALNVIRRHGRVGQARARQCPRNSLTLASAGDAGCTWWRTAPVKRAWLKSGVLGWTPDLQDSVIQWLPQLKRLWQCERYANFFFAIDPGHKFKETPINGRRLHRLYRAKPCARKQ